MDNFFKKSLFVSQIINVNAMEITNSINENKEFLTNEDVIKLQNLMNLTDNSNKLNNKNVYFNYSGEKCDYNNFILSKENNNKLEELFKKKRNENFFKISGKYYSEMGKLKNNLNELINENESINSQIKQIESEIIDINILNQKENKLQSLLNKLNSNNLNNSNNDFKTFLWNYIEELDNKKHETKKQKNNGKNNNSTKITFKDILANRIIKNSDDKTNIFNFTSIEDLKIFINNEINIIKSRISLYKENLNKKKSLNIKINDNEKKIEKIKSTIEKNFNSFYKNEFINIVDDIFKLDPINFEKVLEYTFGNLDKNFFNDDKNVYKTVFLNQQEQILKYCENYKLTNEMLLFLNVVNSISYYTNSNFKGISDIYGTFHLCHIKTKDVNKFFFNYFIEDSSFYLKYNLIKNIIKIELYDKSKKDNFLKLYNIKKNGIMIKNNKEKYEYSMYSEDNILKIYINIDLKLGCFKYFEAEIKDRETKKIYKIYDIFEYLKTETLDRLKNYNTKMTNLDIKKQIAPYSKKLDDYLNSKKDVTNIEDLEKKIEKCKKFASVDIISRVPQNISNVELKKFKNLDNNIYIFTFNKNHIFSQDVALYANINKNTEDTISSTYENLNCFQNSYQIPESESMSPNLDHCRKAFSISTKYKFYSFPYNKPDSKNSSFLKIYSINDKEDNEIFNKYYNNMKEYNEIIMAFQLKKENMYNLISDQTVNSDNFIVDQKFPYYNNLILSNCKLQYNDYAFSYYYDFDLFDNCNPEYIKYLCSLFNLNFYKKTPFNNLLIKLGIDINNDNTKNFINLMDKRIEDFKNKKLNNNIHKINNNENTNNYENKIAELDYKKKLENIKKINEWTKNQINKKNQNKMNQKINNSENEEKKVLKIKGFFNNDVVITEDIDKYFEKSREIKIINSTTTRIDGDTIFKTYRESNKDIKEKIEKALFELKYIKNLLHDSSFKIEKMKGDNNFFHLYLDDALRIYYYYSKDNEITLLDKIGHTDEKK